MAVLLPAAVSLGWGHLPPGLAVTCLGGLGASIVPRLLNRTGLSRIFWHPPLALLVTAMVIAPL
jgi:hypothetical protein